ncbi:unnamed protein product [Timema podura]|uniref:Uncharacterized protein n=1 Tax=Timema podura TaxID=61482 RepID=A0ABN7P5V4_TIMPD|nr:unnamed protein product [Timema podura]
MWVREAEISEGSLLSYTTEVFENFQDTSSFYDNRTDKVCSVPASQETRRTGSVADESRRRDCGVQSRSSEGVTPTQPLPVQCILEGRSGCVYSGEGDWKQKTWTNHGI